MSEFSRARALRQLRGAEAVTLPQNMPPADADDAGDLRAVLAQAYRDDARAYPHAAPAPDLAAAAWGLEAFLAVAHRWYVGAAATPLPPPPPAPRHEDAAAAYHLSADLALRYLPPLLQRIGVDSPDDTLLAETAPLAAALPYSFLLAPKPVWPEELAGLGNACFRGAVVDRVIARDRVEVAHHPQLRPHVEAALGAHGRELWPGFYRIRGDDASGRGRPSPPS